MCWALKDRHNNIKTEAFVVGAPKSVATLATQKLIESQEGMQCTLYSLPSMQGKATMLGGFNNYDHYPTLVEQYDPQLGEYMNIIWDTMPALTARFPTGYRTLFNIRAKVEICQE